MHTVSRSRSDPAVEGALSALAAGRPVILTDDADRADEGDLMIAAEAVTAERMAFIVRHTTGIVCAPLQAIRADELGLGPMVADNTDPHHTAFTVSVDLVGIGTGASARDRAATFNALADASLRPGRLRRPGHVFPLRAHEDGVLRRPRPTEAAVDLLTMAGMSGVAAMSGLVAADGSMLRGPGLRSFAAQHGLPVVAIKDLIRYRSLTERLVEPVARAPMPTPMGTFEAIVYRAITGSIEHLALVVGDVTGNPEHGVLVRVHTECLAGDAFGSLRCECGAQLQQSLQLVAAEGRGVVIYVRDQLRRGIELAHETRHDHSRDLAAQVLTDLGISRVRVLTNNPARCLDLSDHGIEVAERLGQFVSSLVP